MTNLDWFILINCTIVSLSLGIAFYYWHAYHELSNQLDEIWADSEEWLGDNTLEDMARYN